MVKHIRSIGIVLGVVILVSSITCVDHYALLTLLEFEKDVTAEERYWGGYRPGTIYVLQKSVFMKRHIDWSERLILTPPKNEYSSVGLLLYSAPDRIPEDQGRSAVLPGGMAVLEANTRLHLAKVVRHGAYTVGSSLYFFAEILDGEHEGKLVDISDLSRFIPDDSDPVLKEPDPVLIQAEAIERSI